ncbi:uncharacterized protein LOC130727380 isoform X2 [Lotus japonicus]|uniref:uncharacterized protein LOC130727380 isoform X2 n=1 Tax=Lotus japonicus TaxID=34305 RepID=UPI002586F0B8|nr:uncharacterized protein LOC130727380 isoform X2 [Lotus japonicus]XP_057434476.1 uncharacterized protein LOC130727380 isoform X2 [Lotus japonicus]XP_057434477.1 uncharacterized protein LOC130727380 isoform X2 [Lotus japonicus]
MHICRYVPPWLSQILACMGRNIKGFSLPISASRTQLPLHAFVRTSAAQPQFKTLLESRGCLGCFPKPISMDEASKGLITQGSAINNYDRSEDIWSSSSFYMDHSAGYSQRSFSSITIPNHPSDPQSSAGNQIDHPEEFVNHGLRLWKQTRKQWVGNKKTERRMQVGESRISWNATYESLLGTTRPFRQPIPLGEMVEFLVDIWELEGLV